MERLNTQTNVTQTEQHQIPHIEINTNKQPLLAERVGKAKLGGDAVELTGRVSVFASDQLQALIDRAATSLRAGDKGNVQMILEGLAKCNEEVSLPESVYLGSNANGS